jgi:hypothetical protein
MPEQNQQSLNPPDKYDLQSHGTDQPGQNQPGLNQPVFKDRFNRTEIAIWKNEKGYSAQLQKSYKRKDSDEWTRMKISFFPDEIDGAIAVLTKAKEFLNGQEIKTYRVERE